MDVSLSRNGVSRPGDTSRAGNLQETGELHPTKDMPTQNEDDESCWIYRDLHLWPFYFPNRTRGPYFMKDKESSVWCP